MTLLSCTYGFIIDSNFRVAPSTVTTMLRRPFRPRIFRCPQDGCTKVCRSQGGLTQHLHAAHSRQPQIQPPASHLNQLEAEDLGGHPNIPHAEELISEQLPNTGFESEHSERAVPSPTADTNTPLDDTTDTNTPLNISFHPILNGTPCDIDGNDLPLNTPPPAQETVQDFSPFTSHAEFELTDFLFGSRDVSREN